MDLSALEGILTELRDIDDRLFAIADTGDYYQYDLCKTPMNNVGVAIDSLRWALNELNK